MSIPTRWLDSRATSVESKDRGMFDFLGKKEEEPKPQPEAMVAELEKVKIEETVAEEEHKEGDQKKPSFLEKLHRSSSSSSSSSEQEEGEGGEKKKKEKKGLKEKIGGGKEEDDTAVPVEKCDEGVAVHSETPEKKGFMEKIKEKLPGQHKEDKDVTPPPPSAVAADKVSVEHHEEDSKEKKGFFDKIKEMIPHYYFYELI